MKEKKAAQAKQDEGKEPIRQRVLRAAGLSAWVIFGFFAASFLVGVVVDMMIGAGLITSDMNASVLMSVLAIVIYALAGVIVIGIPRKLYNSRTTKEELGLTRLPNWTDILLAPASFVIYTIVAGIILVVITRAFPGFNADEAQEIGFDNLSRSYEYIFAFITLVIAAPVAEELLMRGYLYGKLRKLMPVAGAVLLSALLFSALHLSFTTEQGDFGIGQWNTALNILPLGIILALLRDSTGSIWAGILLHMLKNGVAFYFLFVDPSILHTIGV